MKKKNSILRLSFFTAILLGFSLPAHSQPAPGNLFPKMPSAPKAYVVDCINDSDDACMTAWALQGLINQKSAEVYILNHDTDLAPLQQCGKPFETLTALTGTNSGVRTLFQKYQSRVKRMFIYDSDESSTWCLALVAAAQQDGIPATEAISSQLKTEFGWRGELIDFRKRWPSNLVAYDWAVTNLMPGCSKQVVFTGRYGMPIMDYAAATKGFVFHLDFHDEKEPIKKIFRSKGYTLGSSLMGYTGDAGTIIPSQFGFGYVTGNHFANGSFWSSFPNTTHTQPRGKPMEALPGKVYVSLMWSDGDNLSFDQNQLVKFWADPNHGKVPVATALNPSLQMIDPPLLDLFYAHKTDNDELMAGMNGFQFISTGEFNTDLYPAWCRINHDMLEHAGFHATRNHFSRGEKLGIYMTTCGVDGVMGSRLSVKTGFPIEVKNIRATKEEGLYSEITKVKPDPKEPVFINFILTTEGFAHGGSLGYSAIKRQLDRINATFPGHYVFLLPKDQIATIKAYYDSFNLAGVKAHPTYPEGLIPIQAPDGKFTSTSRGEDLCWLLPKQSPTNFFYFEVANRFRPKLGQTLEMDLEYLDSGSGKVTLEYDSYDVHAPEGGIYKLYPTPVQRANTGKWQTARFLLPDAGFGHGQDNDADFRFHNEGDELYIRAVSLHRVNP